MEDREKMVQLKMELGAENAESGEGSGRVGEETSETAVSQEAVIVEAVLYHGKIGGHAPAGPGHRRHGGGGAGGGPSLEGEIRGGKARNGHHRAGGQLSDVYQAQYYENLIKVASAPKKQVLTDVVLETLSIIAYKQPVTKLEIEKIRGVKSDHAVNRLIEYNLVYEVGRLDAPGRPALFATTEEFLRRFGVGSTKDLPVINPARVDEFKQEVEEELKFVDEAAASGEETGEEKD